MTQLHPRHKPWLSREVSVQWVLGLMLTAVVWVWQKDKTDALEMAALRASVDQRPELVDRRNRELDKLEACMNRQIELLRVCK